MMVNNSPNAKNEVVAKLNILKNENIETYDLLASENVKRQNIFSRLLTSINYWYGAMYKYPVIIFEGIEASGKSSNLNIAANYLKKKRKALLS